MKKRSKKGEQAPGKRTFPPAITISTIFGAYIAALAYAHGRVPPGLNNDVAEEALRGIYLVQGKHFEVLTLAIGNSAETLYLYVLGFATQLFGTTALAIQIASSLAALALVWLVWKLVARVQDGTPAWMPVLLASCSIWLFHYACSGLRAISAPVFTALFALLLDRVERQPPDRRSQLICGGVLGLSIYAYTSTRVLPIAFVAYAVFRLIATRNGRITSLRRYAAVAAGAFLVSIPNLIFAIHQPREFLSRGNYVFLGSFADRVANTIWTILLPFYYPDSYRHVHGKGFDFDGVGAGLTSTGQSPIHIVYAIGLAIGLWQIKRWIGQPVIVFLIAVWITAVLSLGIAGPSPTRMLILLPGYLVFAALGFGWLVTSRPTLTIPVLLLILWAGIGDGYWYLAGKGRTPEYSLCFNPAATAIGETAASMSAQGQRVLSIVSRDANVVNYLTHDVADRTKTVEFYGRPIEPSQIPLDQFHPNALLIENNAAFNAFTAQFPREWLAGANDNFYYVRVPAR
jgi:Dolichyl-phosphate-mannose-protein mannosyltransferase